MEKKDKKSSQKKREELVVTLSGGGALLLTFALFSFKIYFLTFIINHFSSKRKEGHRFLFVSN